MLATLLPILLQRHPRVRVIVGGEGPMRVELEESVRDAWWLRDRVEFIGAVPHDRVPEVPL